MKNSNLIRKLEILLLMKMASYQLEYQETQKNMLRLAYYAGWHAGLASSISSLAEQEEIQRNIEKYRPLLAKKGK